MSTLASPGRSNAIEPTSPGKEGDALAASASAATAAPAAAAKTRIVLPTLGLGPLSPCEHGKSTLQQHGAASGRELDATLVRPLQSDRHCTGTRADPVPIVVGV